MEPILLRPSDTIRDRIEKRKNDPTFTVLLREGDERVSMIFPVHPPRMNLHFLVKVPPGAFG